MADRRNSMREHRCIDFILRLLPLSAEHKQGMVGMYGKWPLLQSTLEHPKLRMRLTLSRAKLGAYVIDDLERAWLCGRPGRGHYPMDCLAAWRTLVSTLQKHTYRLLPSRAADPEETCEQLELPLKTRKWWISQEKEG